MSDRRLRWWDHVTLVCHSLCLDPYPFVSFMFGISFINITYPDNPMRCCYRVEPLCSNIEVGCSLWGAFSVTLLVVEQLLLLCAKWSSLNTWSEQTVFCIKAHTEVWGRSPHNNQEEIHLNIDPLWFTSTLYVMHPPDKWMKCGVLKTNKETGRRTLHLI